MTFDQLLPGIQKSILDDLNELSNMVGKLHWRVHRAAKPIAANPIDLQPAESLRWAATLSQRLADNTCNFRTALKIADGIPEDPVWPEPIAITAPPPGTSQADIDKFEYDLWNTIRLTVGMERDTFQMMLVRGYSGVPDPGGWDPPHSKTPLPSVHDILHELLLNTVAFIRWEEEHYDEDFFRCGRLVKNPSGVVYWPSPPGPNYCQLDALIMLEHGLRRYLQVHMQIATFIPKHLRNVPINLK
jgi:hypothetical protein